MFKFLIFAILAVSVLSINKGLKHKFASHADVVAMPYTAPTGGLGNTWKDSADKWTLPQPGNGILTYVARGNDQYIGLFDTQTVVGAQFKYAIIFGGWGNTLAHIYKNGNFATDVYEFNAHVVDPTKISIYQIIFNQEEASITFFMNGAKIGSWVDPQGWNAPSATHISFSQYSSNFVIYNAYTTPIGVQALCKEIATAALAYPYTPPTGGLGNTWKITAPEWTLPNYGSGILTYAAKGNDQYIGLFATENVVNAKFKYGIIFAGWNNAECHIYKNGDFGTAVGSFPANVVDVNAINIYHIIFNKAKATITIIMNGVKVGSWTDPSGWNAPQATHISFSQYSSNFVIYSAHTRAIGGEDFCPAP